MHSIYRAAWVMPHMVRNLAGRDKSSCQTSAMPASSHWPDAWRWTTNQTPRLHLGRRTRLQFCAPNTTLRFWWVRARLTMYPRQWTGYPWCLEDSMPSKKTWRLRSQPLFRCRPRHHQRFFFHNGDFPNNGFPLICSSTLYDGNRTIWEAIAIVSWKQRELPRLKPIQV